MFQQDQTTIKNQVLTWSRDLTLSASMPNIKVYAYPGPAIDLKVYFQFMGFTIDPKSYKVEYKGGNRE